MNQSKDFVEGIVYALQTIYDFEAKHGHVELDGVVANSLSVAIRDYAVILHRGKFEIVARKTPYGEIFLIGLL